MLVAIGGPLLFLVGTILFKHAIRGFLQLSHGAGIIALCGLGLFGHDLSPLWLSILTTAIMIMVAAWESLSLRGKSERIARSVYFWSTTLLSTRSDSRTTSARSLAFSSSSDTVSVSMPASQSASSS